MTRSALIAPQARKHGRGWLLPRRERQRGGQLVEISHSRAYLAGGAQPLQRPRLRQRREQRHGATPVGHLNRLPRRDPTQELARALPQLPHADTRHVLLIAQVRAQQYRGDYGTTPGRAPCPFRTKAPTSRKLREVLGASLRRRRRSRPLPPPARPWPPILRLGAEDREAQRARRLRLSNVVGQER